jgi:hypothetical protein
MSSSKAGLYMEADGVRSMDSSPDGIPEASSSTASFYQADLDKVQRKLTGIHVHMYVIPFFLYIVLHGSLRN